MGITVMLMFHAVVQPIICAATVGTTGWAAVITFIVIFSFWSINYIALELEMPFGDDLNDLPLQYMQKDFNRSLVTLMHPLALQVPEYAWDDRHLQLKCSKVDIKTYLEDLIQHVSTN